jgi:hypothetical protein
MPGTALIGVVSTSESSGVAKSAADPSPYVAIAHTVIDRIENHKLELVARNKPTDCDNK